MSLFIHIGAPPSPNHQPRCPPSSQLVFPGHNAAPYRPDASDAELDLSAGTPRLYLMHLPYRGREFDRITYHARVTQCLGGLQVRVVVGVVGSGGCSQSVFKYLPRTFRPLKFQFCLHPTPSWLQPLSPWYLVVSPPTLSTERPPRTAADLTAFCIPHGVFVKLHKGTWHAGAGRCGVGCVCFVCL